MIKLNNSYYNTLHFKNAEKFIDYLMPFRTHWKMNLSSANNGEKKWIFRGLGNPNYQLLPSAWRNKKLIDLSVKNIYTKIEDYSAPWTGNIREILRKEKINSHKANRIFKQIFAEMRLVEEFTLLANQSRLSVASVKPFEVSTNFKNFNQEQNFWFDILMNYIAWSKYITNQNNETHEDLLDEVGDLEGYFSFDYNTEMIAYAQHHGIPTRFIDFTYNSLKAAWFALYQYSMTRRDRPNRFAVIAINLEDLLEFPRAFIQNSSYVEIIDNFKLSNFHNLYYQEGLFLNMTCANEFYFKNDYWPDLPKYLQHFLEQYEDRKILKLTLETDQLDNLKEILTSLNINKHMLMPSYDNVSDYIKEKYQNCS